MSEQQFNLEDEELIHVVNSNADGRTRSENKRTEDQRRKRDADKIDENAQLALKKVKLRRIAYALVDTAIFAGFGILTVAAVHSGLVAHCIGAPVAVGFAVCAGVRIDRFARGGK